MDSGSVSKKFSSNNEIRIYRYFFVIDTITDHNLYLKFHKEHKILYVEFNDELLEIDFQEIEDYINKDIIEYTLMYGKKLYDTMISIMIPTIEESKYDEIKNWISEISTPFKKEE